MTDSCNLPEWVRPGARLAAFHPDAGDGGHVTEVTVKRITKTQVVAETEYGTEVWYRLDGPTRRPYRRAPSWSRDETLAPLDADDVVDLLAREREHRCALDVEDLALRWRRDRDPAAARAVADKLVEAGVIASYEPTAERRA